MIHLLALVARLMESPQDEDVVKELREIIDACAPWMSMDLTGESELKDFFPLLATGKFRAVSEGVAKHKLVRNEYETTQLIVSWDKNEGRLVSNMEEDGVWIAGIVNGGVLFRLEKI